jgi:hypothetical protein
MSFIFILEVGNKSSDKVKMENIYEINQEKYLPFIQQKCRLYYFDSAAEELIDSILWQNDEIERSFDKTIKTMAHVARVASKYDSPIDALRMIDRVMPTYLKQKNEGTKFQTGNLLKLSIKSKRTSLIELKKDLEHNLLGLLEDES